MLGVAADLLHPALDVGIKLLPVGERAAAIEDARPFPPRVACHLPTRRLHDRGQPWTGGDVERPAHGEIFSLVVEHVHFRGIEKEAFSTSRTKASSAKESQARHHVITRAPACSARRAPYVVESELSAASGLEGGDDIPARATARDVVERSKTPGDVIGLVERGRSRGDQPICSVAPASAETA